MYVLDSDSRKTSASVAYDRTNAQGNAQLAVVSHEGGPIPSPAPASQPAPLGDGPRAVPRQVYQQVSALLISYHSHDSV